MEEFGAEDAVVRKWGSLILFPSRNHQRLYKAWTTTQGTHWWSSTTEEILSKDHCGLGVWILVANWNEMQSLYVVTKILETHLFKFLLDWNFHWHLIEIEMFGCLVFWKGLDYCENQFTSKRISTGSVTVFIQSKVIHWVIVDFPQLVAASNLQSTTSILFALGKHLRQWSGLLYSSKRISWMYMSRHDSSQNFFYFC